MGKKSVGSGISADYVFVGNPGLWIADGRGQKILAARAHEVLQNTQTAHRPECRQMTFR